MGLINRIVGTIFLIATAFPLSAQNPPYPLLPGVHVLMGSKPRLKQDAERPGHYELVINLEKSEINPGDDLDLDVFFSGYGNIGKSKLMVSPPKIFNFDSSYYNMLEWNTVIRQTGFTSTRMEFPQRTLIGGTIISLGGIQNDGWLIPTDFMDVDSNDVSLGIITDDLIVPCKIHLLVETGIKPGVYRFPVVYTYFNGERWRTSTSFVKFKIKSFVERNVIILTILGLLFGFIAVAPFIVQQTSKSIRFLLSIP